MFKELEDVQWHPDSDVNERLNTVVENHPDLSNLDTPGKRFAYTIKKSRSERFYHALAKRRKTHNLRRLFVRVKNSRLKKQQRRLKWVQTKARLLVGFDTFFTTTNSSDTQDFCKIILGTHGTWMPGGRIWVWQSQDQILHPIFFNNMYQDANYVFHIDTMIQTITAGGSSQYLFSLLKTLLNNYNLL